MLSNALNSEPLETRQNFNSLLIGKIILARFLEIPLRLYERRVVLWESSPHFEELNKAVTDRGEKMMTVDRLGVTGDGVAIQGTRLSENVLGRVEFMGHHLEFHYYSEIPTRQYRFKETELNQFIAKQPAEKAVEIGRIIHRLRLVNTRNRLTHALVYKLLQLQEDFVRTGDPFRLHPLSQAEVSSQLTADNSDGSQLFTADPSRICRLLRFLSLLLSDRREIPLRTLCPTTRELDRHFISYIIKRERSRMVEGLIQEPLTDRQIAEEVYHEFGKRISRRNAAFIRQDLGIPSYRDKARRGSYLMTTACFSPLLPLTSEAVQMNVPQESGVYEVRTTFKLFPHTTSILSTTPSYSVIYIGGAKNLRKRFLDHLRGNSSNELLQYHISCGGIYFRYKVMTEDWRSVERAIYQAFCETFGSPPLCNRISP